MSGLASTSFNERKTVFHVLEISNYNFILQIPSWTQLCDEEIWGGRVIMIKGSQRSSCHFTAPFVLYTSSCIASFSNIGSDPSKFIRVIGVVAVVDLKTTDALKDAQATPDGPRYSID